MAELQTIERMVLDRGKLLSDAGHFEKYWFEFESVVGASEGEQTNFVLVVWESNGEFHGFPVTWKYLKAKGAKDEDRTPQ